MHSHCLQQLGTSRCQRVGRFSTDQFFEFLDSRKRDAVVMNEPTETAAVALLAQRPGKDREVDVSPGFVPGAESAGGDIVADAFR